MRQRVRFFAVLLAIVVFGVSSAQAQTSPNSRWYDYNDSETVFVFVHGIFSDSDSCWKAANGTFWPELVKSDDRFGHPSLYLGGYYTDFSSGIYRVRDAANELLSNLRQPLDADGRPGPLSKPNIIFVAHSTGGLVVRWLLDKNIDLFKDKAVGVVLYASPSRGSAWSNRLAWIREFFGNRMAGELARDNDFVLDLDARFADVVGERRLPRLAGMDLFENKFIVPGRIFGPLWSTTHVVEAQDSASYFGAYRIVPDTDHFSVVKPTNKSAMSHQYLLEFFDVRFKPIRLPKAPPPALPPPPPSTPAGPLALDVTLNKGGNTINGREATHVGEGRDGVVLAITVNFREPQQGLRLMRETYYMIPTNDHDGGGPIMETTESGKGDASGVITYPKGIRGVNFWLEGSRAEQFDVVYKISLTSGATQEGRNGARIGYWYPTRSSTQHQLIWLEISVVPKK